MKRIIILAAAALMALGCCSNQTEMGKDFLQLAHDRYSVRSFSDTKADQDAIDKIIEAGRVAPTAVNSQPQKIYLVQSDEAMAKLSALTPCIYGAPHCFVICYDDTVACKRGETGTWGEVDATIVLTHMALEAADLGLGTCIVGAFDAAALSEALGLPSNVHPVLLLPFGYASEKGVPSDRHSSRKDVSETVEVL